FGRHVAWGADDQAGVAGVGLIGLDLAPAGQGSRSQTAHKVSSNCERCDRKRALQNRAKAHDANRQYAKASAAWRSYIQYSDSLEQAQRTSSILELETKYETERKQKENFRLKQEKAEDDLRIEQLKREDEAKQYWIIILSISALAIIGFLISFFRQRNRREKHRRLVTESQLRRSQINPHFFFNALTAIQANIIQLEDKWKLSKIVSSFAKLMRQTLESSLNEFTEIEEEIAYCTNYVSIQSEVKKRNVALKTVNETADDVMIPSQLIQPFLENALEHAFSEDHPNPEIEIRFTEFAEDILDIQIRDNGTWKAQSTGEHKSRAIEIINQRLALLGHHSKYFLKINGSETGTTVQLRVPFK
ncbi:MAG: histidine kinase, partial [Bacteroidota bacterium]